MPLPELHRQQYAGSLSQEVLQSASKAKVSSSTNVPNVSTVIKAKIVAKSPGTTAVQLPTGQATFLIDGVNRGTIDLINGVAKLSRPSGLSAGQHTITIQYTGDGNFLASTTTVTLTFGSR